ncbi:MAG: FlgD immunoglobulin-like domain containing protein [Armatimonadota bacterium]
MRILRLIAAAALLMAAIPLPNASAQGAPYRNLVNRRFATVSSGPQSALIVDLPAGVDAARRANLVEDRLRTLWRRQAAGLRPRPGTAKAGKRPPLTVVSTVVLGRTDGRLQIPRRTVTRGFGGGTLTFAFENFKGASFLNDRNEAVPIEDAMRQLVDVVYPKLVALYGAPAWSGTVTIRAMGFLEEGLQTDIERLAFGAYDASAARIHLPLFRSIDSIAHALLLNLVHAFHGPLVFQYDAWEQGFARAAATLIARDPSINFLDPTANGLLSLLPTYDLLNQPALANSTFFPPSQANFPVDGVFTIGRMLQPRLGMSGAAWLKCWIENPGFFKDFNTAYYARADTDPAVGGNVPVLRSLAADIVPQVEGRAFGEWFERQYVLDTSVTGGVKLYAFLIPGDNIPPSPVDPGGQSHTIVVVHHRTEAGGEERVLSGRAYAAYFDSEGYRIPTLGAASDQAVVDQGEGFLTTLSFPTAGQDDGKITLDLSLNGVSQRVLLPTGLEGDLRVLAGTSGAIGSVTVSQVVLPSGIVREKTATITRGGFGVSLGSVVGELARTTITVVRDGVSTVHRRNTGDGVNHLVLADDGRAGGVTTVSALLATGSPRLVSFPVRPLEPAIDRVLGLAFDEFVLTQWDPLGNRYEMAVPDKPVLGQVVPGRGYWLRLLPGAGGPVHRVEITGTTPVRDVDFTIPVPYGWNLIGSPFLEQVPIEKILVKFLENDPVSWTEAVDSNLVAAEPFAWDPDGAAYVPTTSLDGGAWKGYWLRVYAPAGVVLLLPGPDAPTRSVKTTRSIAPRRTTPEWTVRVSARVGASTETVALGAAPGATDGVDARWDRELPPDPEPRMAFGFAAAGHGGGRAVGDFRSAANARRATWKLRLSSPVAGEATLRWEGLSTLPRGARLRMTDDATGESFPLDRRSRWTAALAAGATRTFTITAESARTTPLAIAGLRTRSTRGESVRIEYALTGPADVEVTVSTLAGKVLRRLDAGRAEAGSTRSVLWDGRGEQGPLPAGSYLLTVTARGDDGSAARQMRPVTTVR